MSNFLISVVVPIYNVDGYLRYCIDSILRQTYRNLEVILVDDGSTDKSAYICDEYDKIDSRVMVIHKSNGGLSDARNAGIEMAQGELITFIDSDDMISDDMIFYLYDLLIGSNANMSVCQRALIDENNNLIKTKKKSPDRFIIEGNSSCMSRFLTANDIDTVAWGKLYYTSMFKDITFPVGRYHEDVFTTYKLIAKCDRIAVGGEPKYFYRLRLGSITKTSFSEKHLDAIQGKEEVYSFVLEKYPSLNKHAESGIIYACNECVWHLANSDVEWEKYIEYFKKKYRSHYASFIHGNSSLAAKLFALGCFISPEIVVRGIKLLKKCKRLRSLRKT